MIDNRMKRKILIAVLVIAVVGGFFGYRLYNKKTPTASEKDAEETIAASALFAVFQKNDSIAGQLYNDKVIQVSGMIQSVEGGGKTNVYFESGDPSGAVICEFDSTFRPAWSPGQQATIKGICAGLSGFPGMGDVILQRCAVVE